MFLVQDTADTVKFYKNQLDDEVDWFSVSKGQPALHVADEQGAAVKAHQASQVNTGTEQAPAWEPKRVRIVDAEVQLLPNVSAGDTPEQTIAGYRVV